MYLLELRKCLGRMGYQVDILTRQFEGQPRNEQAADRVRVLRFPCGGKEFVPKETLCEHIPEWTRNVRRYLDGKRLRYSFISNHY
ncbi:MAG: glycosyltransferase, partial [Candidatus Binatia bacterium]